MSKAVTFILISTTILILFGILGIADTMTSNVLDAISFSNLGMAESAEFFSKYALVLSLAAAGGAIAIGFLVKSSSVEYLIVGLISLLGTWVVADLIKILATTNGILVGTEFEFITVVVKWVVAALLVGTIMALISYWRGSDG